MPDSIQGAYLLLLGQIALIASTIFFGIPYSLATSTTPLNLDAQTLLYVAFVFVTSSLMIVNILIGWAAGRELTVASTPYSGRLFIADLGILVTFFAMNNVLMFSFGGAMSVVDAPPIQTVLKAGVSPLHLAITSFCLYFLSMMFLVLCKVWNHEYYRLTKKRGTKVYERMLWVIIAGFATISVLSLAFTTFLVQLITLVLWVAGWVYINAHWILANIGVPPKSRARGAGKTPPPTAPLPGSSDPQAI